MRELVDGSTAIVRGALDAGCDFFAGYPITPASPILMAMMTELPRLGGIAVQGEDEIASIGMCLGAAMGGARTMTATSGPGMSLYSENIGLAVMGEVPLVIVDVQRLGPATGGATTVGQGDVQFVRWGTAGGYPLIVLAPSSVADCYWLTIRAFELAERYRCPVILLTDKELNLTSTTVELGVAGLEPGARRKRGDLLDPFAPAAGEYRPYRFDPPEGVAPLVRYGDGEIVRLTGSTHDERATLTKDPATIERLNRHLTEKIEANRAEIETVDADLEPGAETLVCAYGVTAGAMRAATLSARRAGRRLSALAVQSLWPVPASALTAALEGVERVVVAELNQGQYRSEIEKLTGDREVVGVHRVDGELITPEQILEAVA